MTTLEKRCYPNWPGTTLAMLSSSPFITCLKRQATAQTAAAYNLSSSSYVVAFAPFYFIARPFCFTLLVFSVHWKFNFRLIVWCFMKLFFVSWNISRFFSHVIAAEATVQVCLLAGGQQFHYLVLFKIQLHLSVFDWHRLCNCGSDCCCSSI